MPQITICPNHEGNFDCTPFCPLCEGNQEFETQAEATKQLNTEGNVFAYRYKGVTIRVEAMAFTFWKSGLGYDLFSKDNHKLYFDTLEEAESYIDLNKKNKGIAA